MPAVAEQLSMLSIFGSVSARRRSNRLNPALEEVLLKTLFSLADTRDTASDAPTMGAVVAMLSLCWLERR